MNEFVCEFCNKKLKRLCALAIHERTCKLNPNRRPLENHVNGFAEYNMEICARGLCKQS